MTFNHDKFPESQDASSFGKYLSKINSPTDLRSFPKSLLADIVDECRNFIIDIVSKNGGHFGASLGVVELTVAIHYTYNTPHDLLVWDVGHQAYVHKILTGRKNIFYSNRKYQGISGFPKRDESDYDTFGVGHASTSISAATGMAVARTLLNSNAKVIAVIGDGALTGGMSFEALNHLGYLKEDITIVLNDNKMSIDPNIGGLKDHLANLATRIATDKSYNKIRSGVWDSFGRLNKFGKFLQMSVSKINKGLKSTFTPGGFFESLGLRYFGPIDGHDVLNLVKVLSDIKEIPGPKVLHILTTKGKGYSFAEKDQLKWHAQGSAFDKVTGKAVSLPKKNIPTYQKVFGETISSLAQQNQRIVGITAAMPSGTSLNMLLKTFPDRFFDVGIAEQHALTFAAGMAAQGYKPIIAIYSTFLQRAYDQIIHDIALQKLNIVFCIDRSGLVGADGATHHGAFDISYLRPIPNMTIMAPSNEDELRHMIFTAVEYNGGPISIRYPRGQGTGIPLSNELKKIPIGKAEVLQKGEKLAILCFGTTVNSIKSIFQKIEESIGYTPFLSNMRFAKPLDEDLLTYIGKNFKGVITLEENVIPGGFGSAVCDFFSSKFMQIKTLKIGLPDNFIDHGNVSELYEEIGMSKTTILSRILAFINFLG